MSFDEIDDDPTDEPQDHDSAKLKWPAWAPSPDGEWTPVHPSFWPVWRKNKATMKEAGVQVGKFGKEYRVRFMPKD